MNNNKFYKIGVAVSVLLIGVIVACIVIAQKQDDKVAKAEDFPSVSSSTNVVENEVNVAEQTDFKEIISKFIEKIKNREESENIMMNAARIINKEIRKQRREGREEGMIFVAKKLKGKMHIKDISQITGLSEKEIEKL